MNSRTLSSISLAINRVPPTTRGMMLAFLSAGFFASMHGSVRYLSSDLHAFEIAFFRAFFGFMFFAPLLVRTRLSILRTRRLPLHLLRGVFNGGSLLCWFTALSLIPLGDATALSLVSPIFVTVGAMFFLGERSTRVRWLAIWLGLVGALFVVRPGFQEINHGMILVLAGMLMVTFSKLMAKSLARTDEPSTIVAYLSLTMSVPSGIATLFVWRTPTIEEFAILILIGCLGSTGHLLLTTAYKIADISAVEPVVYVRLAWAALIGWLLFSEFPAIWTWVGAALIIFASLLLMRLEAGRQLPDR